MIQLINVSLSHFNNMWVYLRFQYLKKLITHHQKNSQLTTQNSQLSTQNPKLTTQNPKLTTQNPKLVKHVIDYAQTPH